MQYKTNWPEAQERWRALWERRCLDRPCMTVTTPNGVPREWPRPESGEQLWLDPDFFTRSLRVEFKTTYYGGESFPSRFIQACWVINTYGATPHFPMDTIWFEPRAVDWDAPPSFVIDWDSPWFKKVFAMYDAVLNEAGYDNFLAGGMGSMPAGDMLTFVLGTEQVLLGMAEHPDWISAAIHQLAANWVTFKNHFSKLAQARHAYWYGNAGWMPFWAPEPFVSIQSDLSCMISPEMFERFVMPELDLAGREFGHVWYHLDGQSAFQHRDRLLSLPYLKVMQFEPMAGTPPNGPAHLDLYRRIQAAGKIVHIGLPKENVEPLIKALDPALLCLDTHCASIREADELLAAACRWTKAR